MSIAIQIENISKQYNLKTVGSGTLSHDLNRWWALMRGKEDPNLKLGEMNDRSTKGNSDLVWALKNVSFNVNQGEVLGIIGKNGAGKSTLLKILSRTTRPTTGSLKIKGRIASLLEVGTGFHPELSGRENIYLNGTILGMKKSEIKSKFDEIVDFSGVERYIDTPVKRYSSGMYVRLAFAVAAHLEPEILIVDEVLAVGDAEFQKKCIGKMKEISVNDGRTVLFVSHNMSAIRNLCTSGVILKNGALTINGNIDKVLAEYLADQTQLSNIKLADIPRKDVNGLIKFTDIRLVDKNGIAKVGFVTGESLEIIIDFIAQPVFYLNKISTIDIGINDALGNRVTWMSTSIYKDKIENGKKSISFLINKMLLNQGNYTFSIFCKTDNGIADWIQNASTLSVTYQDFYGTGKKIPESQGYLVSEFTIK